VCQYQSARVRAFLCASVRKKQKNKKTKPPRVAKTVAKTRAASAPSRARARRDAEKSDLKSSYVDFDPHCASALDFGTIITFLRGGDERERDADATENARNAAREEETSGGSGGFHAPAQTISPVGSTASDTN
jgi:hypothetical protein